jgi:large subunit ribosomal protein L25
MEIPTIKVWPREEKGTRPCRRLRRRGLVPPVLYGRGEPNVLLSVQEAALEKLLAQHSLIVRVEWNGQGDPAQIKEIQYDYLGERIIHADFGRISLTETVQVAVPIETHGESVGVKEGGVLELVMHEIEVECLPTNIPENIRVEIAALKIGDDLRIRDLPLPEGMRAMGAPDAVVLMVASPTVVEEQAAPEEEVVAEPELIGKPAVEEEEPEEGRGERPQQSGSP